MMTDATPAARPAGTAAACRICRAEMRPFGQAQILGKYSVSYFQCPACGYTCTEEPYWLAEAYAEAINESDVGLVARNQQLARTTKAVINLCFNRRGKFIDYGAGYGLMVRHMRDYGYDFYWQDKFCANLFAKVAPADTSGRVSYELLTAFELFEHLPRPAEELPEMLRLSKSILFTTQLLPEHNPRPGSWWYYGLDHGQHVSLYTRRSLELLAGQHGLHLYSDGRFIHLMTAKRISPRAFTLATSFYASLLLSMLIRRPSLVPSDYERVTGRPID